MFAQVRTIGIAALTAVSILAGSAVAGPIPAGSSPDGPTMLSAIAAGTVVGDNQLVTTQYQGSGLSASIFQEVALAAVGSIGGTNAFIPTVSTAKGFVVDYSSFIGFQVVNPTTGLFSTTGTVSVEFIGPRASNGFLYAMTPDGGILGSTVADDGIGPNGGMLATLNLAGTGILAAWSLFDPNAPDMDLISTDMTWGIASINITGDGPIPDPPGNGPRTPEPTTLALALGGLFGVAGAGWKRRRATRK